MANMLGRLGVVLGLDAAEFVSGINKAERNLKQFAESAVQYGKIGATALAAMSVAAIKFADDIQDVAQANDVAIDTVIKLRSALDASGGSAEKAGVMLSAFTKFIDTAASGSFEAQKALSSVGVSFKDIGRLSQEELLGKALRGLESIEDPITRNARAMDLFSKAAKGVAFDSFAQEMQKTSTATREQVNAVKEGAKTWDNFEKIIRKLQLAFVEALGPSLSAINNQMSAEAFPKLTMLNKLFNSIASNAFSAGQAIEALGKGFEKIAGTSLIMQTYGESAAGYAEVKKLNEEYVRFLENQRKAQAQFDSDLEGGRRGIRTDVYPKGGRPAIGSNAVVRQTTMGVDTKAQAAADKIREDWYKRVNKSIEEAQKLSEANYRLSLKELDVDISRLRTEEDLQLLKDQTYQSILQSNRLQSQQLDFDRANLLLVKQFTNLRSEEVKYAQDVMSIRAKYAEQEYQIATFSTMNEHEKTKALEENNNLRDRAIQQAKEALDITRQSREGTMADGFTKGFDEFVRDMPTRMEMGKTAFNSLMSSMDSALRRFVQTGKINFADLVRSMIQELIYLESKAKMMDIFKSLKGDGGGGIMDMLSGLFGGGGGMVSTNNTGMSLGELGLSGGRASGGSVSGGSSYLVGERGPEIFAPRMSGTIIPNNQLASAMGGGQTINYNGPYIASMNAIDTQSGTQFLAKNKNTIWAAYQSANRGVPVSR
jgi:lambda family phage tail tape measure protein